MKSNLRQIYLGWVSFQCSFYIWKKIIITPHEVCAKYTLGLNWYDTFYIHLNNGIVDP